jgi:hypothetical protein
MMNPKLFSTAVLCAITLLIVQQSARAQATDERPLQELFQTEAVYSQERGETQFTLVSKFSKNSNSRRFENLVALEYGISDGWQVTLEWSAMNRLTSAEGKTRGVGDLRIGTKHSWMNIRHSNFHAAAGFELGLPTGNVAKELGEGNLEYEPYVVIAKDFPKLSRLQVFSQIGLTFARHARGPVSTDDRAAKRTIEWNNGLFIPYRKVRFTGEVNWARSVTENSLYFTPGVIWKLPRELEFGVGIPVGVTRDADRFRAIVKLIYEFGGANRAKATRLDR